MVRVNYSRRVLCDSYFLDWLSKQPDKETLLSQLMHIKGSSGQHRKEHNVILETQVKKCQDMPKIDSKYLGGAFKITEDPEFLSVHDDEITKNVIFAIYLTHESPYACSILTAPQVESKYTTNKHYNRIRRVEVKSGDEAKKLISDFFRAFAIAREKERTGA